jgi:hypothetical protein
MVNNPRVSIRIRGTGSLAQGDETMLLRAADAYDIDISSWIKRRRASTGTLLGRPIVRAVGVAGQIR